MTIKFLIKMVSSTRAEERTNTKTKQIDLSSHEKNIKRQALII